MPSNNASGSTVKSSAIRLPLPIGPCERRRDDEISQAGAAPGPVGKHYSDGFAPDPGLNSQRERIRVAFCWLSLLLILPLAVAGAHRMADKISDGVPGSSTRIGWYLQSGQWLADVRTFTAACEFVLEGDPDAVATANSLTNQPVGNPGIEAAFNSGSRGQMETGVN